MDDHRIVLDKVHTMMRAWYMQDKFHSEYLKGVLNVIIAQDAYLASASGQQDRLG